MLKARAENFRREGRKTHVLCQPSSCSFWSSKNNNTFWQPTAVVEEPQEVRAMIGPDPGREGDAVRNSPSPVARSRVVKHPGKTREMGLFEIRESGGERFQKLLRGSSGHWGKILVGREKEDVQLKQGGGKMCS